MRLATYNIEWFTHLFDDTGGFLPGDGWSGRRDVRRADQAEAIAHVLTVIDADAVLVVEAPDSHGRRDGLAALRTFAQTAGLRAQEPLMGFVNDTQQELAVLYDPGAMSLRHDPCSAGAPRFDGSFAIDIDVDRAPETIRWSKPPLELSLTTPGGAALRMIGVHAKSKAPHGARGADEIMAVSIANRRKQLAQCIWLRKRVEAHLAAGDSLVVLGDFNDGPGLDSYEALFGRSGVEIVLGEDGGPPLCDPHAHWALSNRMGPRPTTARFRIPPDGRFLTALLDYIMVSPDLRERHPRWRIWHPFEDPDCYRDAELRQALLTASDHFPVTLDIEF